MTLTVQEQIKESVKEYYGKVIQTTNDLKTSACCIPESMPNYIKSYLSNIHPEILEKFYGCGSPIPLALEGKTVLDLGCGTGRDCYLLAQIVGPVGKVIGVDMTDEQLDIARKYVDHHMKTFSYPFPNVEFKKGYIEDLASPGFEDNSIDVVVSNCVINLSPDKEKVFQEIFRVLKPGGELYFSDVFSDRRIPDSLTRDDVLVGECLGGALYIEDFRRMLTANGCLDYRTVTSHKIALEDEDVYAKAGMINFHSMTIRAFKCDYEDICENYGHVAFYKGTLHECPHEFVLDDHHVFPKGIPVPICGNTAKMLLETRYSEYFDVVGDFSNHYGAFDCGDNAGNTFEETLGSCC
ncbi:MAG: methyltransferase domain-containing protein [Candidatus Marinimicrobia bacterium]|nr:methyltransferase domain-containing protein [Candidatus Neomarinimicrobiota bacterium]